MTAFSSKFGRQTIKIPCKVNLHLGIHAQKDQRGYHKVDSLMVPVALFDTVVVDDAPELTVTHEPQLCVLPERTTTWKAAVLLANKLGISPDVSIDVQVHIPEKAGLGGSSADAAATLYLLAQRWGVDPLDPLVVEVAKAVGADVAFFLDPRPSLMLGAGDTPSTSRPSSKASTMPCWPGRNESDNDVGSAITLLFAGCYAIRFFPKYCWNRGPSKASSSSKSTIHIRTDKVHHCLRPDSCCGISQTICLL